MQCQCRMNKSQKVVHHLNIWFWATTILLEGQLPFLATGCKEGSRFSPVFSNLFLLSQDPESVQVYLHAVQILKKTPVLQNTFQLIYFTLLLALLLKIMFSSWASNILYLCIRYFGDCKSVLKTHTIFFCLGPWEKHIWFKPTANLYLRKVINSILKVYWMSFWTFPYFFLHNSETINRKE